MTKHKSGYLLPPENEIETPDRICVKFEIPNTTEYRTAVMGQIYELCKWWAWDKTTKGDTRATRASHMFRDTVFPTFEFLTDCSGTGETMTFDVRVQNCMLQKSEDGGQSWQDVSDLSLCAPDEIVFSQDGCKLLADGTMIFDAEVCKSDDTTNQPEDTPEPKEEGGNLSNYCAGSKGVANDFIALMNYYVAKFQESNFEIITTINVVSLGLYEIAKGIPLVSSLISMFEYMVSYDEAEILTHISNPAFFDELTCHIYCAVKEYGGFNEQAWNAVLANYPDVDYPSVVTEFIGHAMHRTYLFKDATKKFYIESLNTDNTCEALCTDCQTKWSINATDYNLYHSTNQTPYVNLSGSIQWDGVKWTFITRPADFSVLIDLTTVPDNAFSVTEVQIAFTNMGWGNPPANLYVEVNGAWKLIDSRDSDTGAGGMIYTVMTFGKKFKLDMTWNTGPYYGSTIMRLSSVTLRGYGTRPDMLPDIEGVQ